MIRKPIPICIAVLFLPLTGCGPSDDRVGQYAQWSVNQQSQQNQQQAQQNESLIGTQQLLDHEIHQERAHLDQQKEQLDTQRQEIADQRIHEPLVAESIRSTGLLLACLFPLLICAYALKHAGHRSTDEELSAILLQEMVSDPKQTPDLSMPTLPIGTERLLK